MSPATPPQLALLRAMVERGLSLVGVLGADALHPNWRIYFTSDGMLVNADSPNQGWRTVHGLESRQMVREISTSGEDPPRLRHVVATELGRLAVQLRHAEASQGTLDQSHHRADQALPIRGSDPEGMEP
jgi:hypothetical protein